MRLEPGLLVSVVRVPFAATSWNTSGLVSVMPRSERAEEK